MENKQKKDPDEVIALAICLYEADGYPENSFEMLDYVMSHKYCQKASRLMDDGYTRAKQVDERIVLDVDAVYREILNVQEEIESEHKDISLLASQRRRMAVRIVNTFKPKVEVTEDEMKLNVRQSLLGHGKLHKKYWAEPTKTQEISYGRWRQDLAEGIVEHLIQLLKDKGIL